MGARQMRLIITSRFALNLVKNTEHHLPSIMAVGKHQKKRTEHCLSPKEWLFMESIDYELNGTSKKFLCKYHGTRKVYSTSKAFYLCLIKPDSDFDQVAVMCYDSAGSLIGSKSLINSFTTYFHFILRTGRQTNAIPQSEIATGTAG